MLAKKRPTSIGGPKAIIKKGVSVGQTAMGKEKCDQRATEQEGRYSIIRNFINRQNCSQSWNGYTQHRDNGGGY